MTVTYDQIRTALDDIVRTAIGDVPLKSENRRITETKQPWVRTTLLPAQPIITSQYEHQLRGLYQVDVITPIDFGTKTADSIASAVLQALPRAKATLIDGDRLFTELSWIQAGRSIDGHYQVPVIVQWSTLQSRIN